MRPAQVVGLSSGIAGGVSIDHPPFADLVMGTMDSVAEHHSANGRCSLCGRRSEDVTTAELGNWIVQDGGVVICSECSSDAEKAAAGPATFRTSERVEQPPPAGSRTAVPVGYGSSRTRPGGSKNVSRRTEGSPSGAPDGPDRPRRSTIRRSSG
jgi:hypothetical protein